MRSSGRVITTPDRSLTAGVRRPTNQDPIYELVLLEHIRRTTIPRPTSGWTLLHHLGIDTRRKGASPSVSRILSRTVIHLGAPLPSRSCGLPVTIRRATGSLLGLAPGGVCRAVTVARDAGGLLPHRFTLACARMGHRRSVLCCTFRRVAPPGSYPAPCPLESGLSSIFRLRPSDGLAQMILRPCELPSTRNPACEPGHDHGYQCQQQNR